MTKRARLVRPEPLNPCVVARPTKLSRAHQIEREFAATGFKSPVFGVESEGQGVSFGMNVVTRTYLMLERNTKPSTFEPNPLPAVCAGPSKSKLAGGKGSFSSWGYYGTECWSDPTLDMTVFVGTQLSPFWALPENRQELAGLIYGALVSTPAAKHFKGGTDAGGGGMVRKRLCGPGCATLLIV